MASRPQTITGIRRRAAWGLAMEPMVKRKGDLSLDSGAGHTHREWRGLLLHLYLNCV